MQAPEKLHFSIFGCHLGCHPVKYKPINGKKKGRYLVFQNLVIQNLGLTKNIAKKSHIMSHVSQIQVLPFFCFLLGCHLEYLNLLNDDRVASLGFFKRKV